MSGLPKPPPMKVMLTDMYECCDNLLDNAGISHNAVLVDLKKGSNAKFLQTNICLMMTLIKALLESAQGGCGGCSEYIKELEEQLNEESKEKLKNKECWMSVQKQYHELKEEKDSWQDGEFKLTKLLSEEREKNVDLLNEIKQVKEEHKKFDEIWKTEGITEDDIIGMKRQISDQCDLIKQLKKDNKMLDVKQAKATKKADSQMKMKQQYEKQFDDISQQLNKLRQQLDKIDN